MVGFFIRLGFLFVQGGFVSVCVVGFFKVKSITSLSIREVLDAILESIIPGPVF